MQTINQNILDNLNNFHLAGIIPVAGLPAGEHQPGLLHPSLVPLSGSLLAIERSILECNYAGCKTIWIVCNEDIQPAIKYRVKDYTTSFTSLVSSKFSKFSQPRLEYIPIFYVSIPLPVRDKRDSLGWTVLHGAQQAFTVCTKISKWVIPNKYYVSIPYGVQNPQTISNHKKQLFSTRNIFTSYKNNDVSSGLMTSFSFRPADFIRIKKNVKKLCTGSVSKPYWSSKNFTIDKFFNYDNIDNVDIAELDHYYRISNWFDYKEFLSSESSALYDSFDAQKINHTLKERITHETK